MLDQILKKVDFVENSRPILEKALFVDDLCKPSSISGRLPKKHTDLSPNPPAGQSEGLLNLCSERTSRIEFTASYQPATIRQPRSRRQAVRTAQG